MPRLGELYPGICLATEEKASFSACHELKKTPRKCTVSVPSAQYINVQMKVKLKIITSAFSMNQMGGSSYTRDSIKKGLYETGDEVINLAFVFL